MDKNILRKVFFLVQRPTTSLRQLHMQTFQLHSCLHTALRIRSAANKENKKIYFLFSDDITGALHTDSGDRLSLMFGSFLILLPTILLIHLSWAAQPLSGTLSVDFNKG